MSTANLKAINDSITVVTWLLANATATQRVFDIGMADEIVWAVWGQGSGVGVIDDQTRDLITRAIQERAEHPDPFANFPT